MDTYDIAVVGCGPVGLALARLLSAKGLRVAAIDPNRIVCHHPRATHLDDESMRTLQTLGAADMRRRHRGNEHAAIAWHPGQAVNVVDEPIERWAGNPACVAHAPASRIPVATSGNTGTANAIQYGLRRGLGIADTPAPPRFAVVS